MKIRILIILLILISACKEKNKTDIVTDELNNQTVIIIPENVDSDFKLFLDFFNKDSIFQMSRVDFPLKVNDFYKSKHEFELEERIVNSDEYYLKRFSINKKSNKESFGEYEQTMTIESDKAILEINGIENGIAVEYEFKKVNGKWKLITWIDQST